MPKTIVHVVDDDAAIRQALSSLLRSVGYEVALYDGAAAFLAAAPAEGPSCLVLDVRLPGISGLDFQDELVRRGVTLPIVFMTGHGDIPMSVRGMKAGAVDFLPKPFREQDMLDAIAAALSQDTARRARSDAEAGLRTRWETLSAREREVARRVASGLLNKQVAYELGLSEITVKVHRGNAMRKLGLANLPDLVRALAVLSANDGPYTNVSPK